MTDIDAMGLLQDEPRVLEEEDVGEQLEELGSADLWAQGAALASNDWTAETILSQLSKNNVDLTPKFQRRSVWSEAKQSRFIESLIIGVPVPQLVLAEGRERGQPYIVIDGKQRLLALLHFGCLDSQSELEPLRLSGLKMLKRLNGKTYADIMNEEDFKGDLISFENSSIRTAVIRNWKNEEYLYETFLRINTESVPLSTQELRQALHPGPFSDFIRSKSGESKEIQLVMNITKPDFRMRDAEILLRYISYKNFIHDYRGNLKAFHDNVTEILNRDWEKMAEKIESQICQMDEAFKFTKDIFGKDYMRKSDGVKYQNRVNRAVMDIMLHYFSCPEIRDALTGSFSDIKKRFTELCGEENFLSSLERTTKSIEMNRIRFNTWAHVIEDLSGLNIDHMKFSL